MASVFKKDEQKNRSVIEIIRDSLDVDAEGTVRFRSRIGRGSGKAIEIPGDEFDDFVSLMIRAQEDREDLAQQERESATSDSSDSEDASLDNDAE